MFGESIARLLLMTGIQDFYTSQTPPQTELEGTEVPPRLLL